MIVLVTKDLFFVPLVKAAAEKQATEIITVPGIASARLDQLSQVEVTACIVDLTAISAADISIVATQLREKFYPVQLIAFGPHVHESQLQAAQAAGFDAVLTRGQLNAHIDRYMQQWTLVE